MAATHEDIETAISFLINDSKKWVAVSNETRAIAGKADGLALTVSDLGYLSEHAGLVATYNDTQNKLAGLLHQGAEQTDRIADAMVETAQYYEKNEQQTQDTMNRKMN